MFQAIAIVIVVMGTFAIIYTIVGAVSGRSLTIGLVLAGLLLGLQVFSLAFSAITDPPQDKASNTQDSPTPEPSAQPSPGAAASAIQFL
jgi:hypothetical protein